MLPTSPCILHRFAVVLRFLATELPLDTAEEIIATLDKILVDQFELAADDVVPSARLREDLDLDSLDAADMMIAIEKRFGIRLDDTVARTFTTVGDIHGYVHKLVAEKNADSSLSTSPAPTSPATSPAA